jgi:hypothetical protein
MSISTNTRHHLKSKILKVDDKKSKKKDVFTVGSWSCGTNSATTGRQYRPLYTVILLYVSEGFIRLILLKDSYRFQVGTLSKSFVTKLVYDLSSLVRNGKNKYHLNFFCVLMFYKLVVMWCRKMVLN